VRDKISNQEALTLVCERRYLMITIWQRKKNCVEHVLRGHGQLRLCWRNAVEKRERENKNKNVRLPYKKTETFDRNVCRPLFSFHFNLM